MYVQYGFLYFSNISTSREDDLHGAFSIVLRFFYIIAISKDSKEGAGLFTSVVFVRFFKTIESVLHHYVRIFHRTPPDTQRTERQGERGI